MDVKKIGVLSAFCWIGVLPLSAKQPLWLHPQIALIGSSAFVQNKTDIRSGDFAIRNRMLNLGFSITNKFYIAEPYFFDIGLRFTSFKTTVKGLNPFAERFNNPSPLLWSRNYSGISIPVWLGRAFKIRERVRGSYFAGVSIGVLMTGGARDEVFYDLPRNANNFDEIKSEISEANLDLPTSFYSMFDIGMDYQPLKSLPGLTIGVIFSMQVNKTSFQNDYNGIIQNLSQNKKYSYDMSLSQQFSQLSVKVGYMLFDRRQRLPKFNPLNCPH